MDATAEAAQRGTTLATTVAIDLAKDVFEIAFADVYGRISERKRLWRSAFAGCLDNRPPLRVVMEAFGSAHHWARRFARSGHAVVLLPAHDVRPYVRRRKTNRADAAGLLEATRCGDINPVPVKSPGQQSIWGLHRIREHHKAQRTGSINTLRGLMREFGIVIPSGSDKVRVAALAALADGDNDLPMDLRHALAGVLEQIAHANAAMAAIEQQLQDFARRDTRSQRYQRADGIGLLTATAISASVGDLQRYRSGRHFASALGLTPREHSSGDQRRLGRITKRGDAYLRTLLIQGARAVLCSARTARKRGDPLDRTRSWALELADRIGHNKAAVALANKTARRLWAAEHHGTAFDPGHISRQPG